MPVSHDGHQQSSWEAYRGLHCYNSCPCLKPQRIRKQDFCCLYVNNVKYQTAKITVFWEDINLQCPEQNALQCQCWKYCGVELQQYCSLTAFIIVGTKISVEAFLLFFAEANHPVNAVWEARRTTWSQNADGRAGKVGSDVQRTKHAPGKCNCLIITRNCDKSQERMEIWCLWLNEIIWFTVINMAIIKVNILHLYSALTWDLYEALHKMAHTFTLLWQWMAVYGSVFCSIIMNYLNKT